jgi:hypothetical protein
VRLEQSPSSSAKATASAASAAPSIALWMPPPFSGSAWFAASPDEEDAIAEDPLRPVERGRTARDAATLVGLPQHVPEVALDEGEEGLAQVREQRESLVVRVAEADVGEAVVVDEEPAVAGKKPRSK